ncbi:MAG: MBL fold metallo-hydrolase [Anaerolineae bacterium]
MIVKQLTVGPFQANCYLVGCEETKEGVVIDPGDEGSRILAEIESLGLIIQRVLLTHAHYDHIVACDEVCRATGAPLAMHKEDLPLLKAGGGGALWGLPTPVYREPDLWLQEGDDIYFGQHTLRVLFTPGHAPGHVTFHEVQEKVVFDGDVLFAGGIGRSDLPGGSHQVLMDSIQTRLMTLPPETTVYSGHGPPTTIGQERVSNPWL